MIGGMRIKAITQRRSRLYQPLHFRILAVQDTQWIRLQASLTVFVECRVVIAKILYQQLAIFLPTLTTTEAVNLQVDILQAQTFPETRSKQNQFGFDICA